MALIRSIFSWPAIILAVMLLCHDASAQEGFKSWNLEPAVGQAHLVMVARVVSIGRLTVVEGAKTDLSVT